MVLPGTLAVALALLCLSLVCFGLWPVTFRLAGPKWRFQLFSVDFAVGALVLAGVAAYTLGTLGSELGFTDSLLVAGRREQVISVLAGMDFAFSNMCFLVTIALLGLANASSLTACVFGFALALVRVAKGDYVTSSLALIILAAGVALAVLAAKTKRARTANPAPLATGKPGTVRPVIRSNTPEQGRLQAAMVPSTKGIITGFLSALGFLALLPLIKLVQPEIMGVGAYGGILLASVGILAATLCLNLFFLNISLEGVTVSYGNYISGSLNDHIPGLFGGAVWATGALALYAAQTGTVSISRWEAWLPVFGGAIVAALCGMASSVKPPHAPKATRLILFAIFLLMAGTAALLIGSREQL